MIISGTNTRYFILIVAKPLSKAIVVVITIVVIIIVVTLHFGIVCRHLSKVVIEKLWRKAMLDAVCGWYRSLP